MKINKILIPYDASECAENALNYALNIIDSQRVILSLLKVCLLPSTNVEFGYHFDKAAMDSIENANLENLRKVKQGLANPENCEVETITDISVKNGIQNRVKIGDIDMIVMGSHGNSGINEILFGSHASEVVRSTEVPLLIVPDNYKNHQLKKIAYAGDYLDTDQPRDAKVLAEICKITKAELDIFNVNPSDEAITADKAYNAAQMEDYFKATKHSYHEVHHSDPEQGILGYVKEHQIDLLTMVPRKHSLRHQLFKSSVTRKVVHHLDIPTLILHEV